MRLRLWGGKIESERGPSPEPDCEARRRLRRGTSPEWILESEPDPGDTGLGFVGREEGVLEDIGGVRDRGREDSWVREGVEGSILRDGLGDMDFAGLIGTTLRDRKTVI